MLSLKPLNRPIVCTLGSAVWDTILLGGGLPILSSIQHGTSLHFTGLPCGQKLTLEKVICQPGGGALNTARVFAACNMQVYPVATVGNDIAGITLSSILAQEGIASELLSIAEGPTGQSFVIPSPDGDRTILTLRGANDFFAMTEDQYEWCRKASLVYIAPLGISLVQLSDIIGQIVSVDDTKTILAWNPSFHVDYDRDALRLVLSQVDILVVNLEEAELLATILEDKKVSKNTQERERVAHFLRILHMTGPSCIAITNGADGSYGSNGTQWCYCPAKEATVLHSTVGAGDAFGAIFTASILKGNGILTSLEAASEYVAHIIATQ